MKAEELQIGDWVKLCNKKGEWLNNSQVDLNLLNRQAEGIVVFDPIILTPEILEMNGFKKDAFTNLSPDYYFGDDECSICVNLNSTCDKSKSIWIEKRSSRFIVKIEESRHSLDKKPLYVHQLQHVMRLCGIDKEITLN